MPYEIKMSNMEIEKQLEFVKTLANRLPDTVSEIGYFYTEPPKTQVKEDIKRLRRELMELYKMLDSN